MDGLSVAANVAGVVSLGVEVTKALLKYYNDYKDREAEVASTIKKLDRLLGMLENLTTHLNNNAQSLPKDQKMLVSIQSAIGDCEECIEELQEQCEKFKDAPTTGIKAKARTVARKLAYPLRQSTLDAIDETVDEIVSHISLALQIIQQRSIDQIQTEAEEIKSLLELVQANQVDSEVRDWLKAPNVSSNYYAACGTRHPGTGKWLVEGDAFSNWLSSTNSFLWLYGFAGCGKSVLCSTAIQHVFRHRHSNLQIGIAFFFFTFNDNNKQDVLAMLRALVLQLSGQVRGGNDVLAALHKIHKHGDAPKEVLVECLKELIQSTDGTYILVDALDESPIDSHRWKLLEFLIDMRNWSEDRLHLLVTSRDEPDIREAIATDMDAGVDKMISLRNDSVSSDIEAYITGALERDRRLRKWADFHEHIKESLAKRAEGVFRWVECQIIALAATPKSKRQLDAVLAALPRSLDETYERVLGNIGEESKSDARRLLVLLCCSWRPLTVAEVIEGIAVELGDNPRINPDGRLKGEDDILALCPGLVEVDRHGEVFQAVQYECPSLRKAAPPDTEVETQFLGAEDDLEAYPASFHSTVRIAHFSVQEYLESKRICEQSASKFSVKLPDAHAEIASVCLTYLLGLPSRLWNFEYGLALYAANYWHGHYRKADTTKHSVQDQALQLFGPDTSKLDVWIRLRGEAKMSPFYVLSILRLPALLLREILHREPYCNLSHEQLGQALDEDAPLLEAVRHGDLPVVELLLENGACIDIWDKYHSPLTLSVARKSPQIAQLLIDQGADLDICPAYGKPALLAALDTDNAHVFDILLQKGAKAVERRTRLSAGELFSRAMKTSMAMTKSLLKTYGKLDMGGWYNEDVDIVDVVQSIHDLGFLSLILDHIANIHVNENDFNKRLWSNYNLFDFKKLKLMLKKGVRVPLFSTLLWCSVYLRGNPNRAVTERLGQFLLDNSTNSGYCAMMWFVLEHVGETVASYGLMGMAERLFQCSPDLDDGALNDGYSVALQFAAKHGRYEAVQLLLDAGADVNFEGGRYSNALYAAVLGGNNAVVRLLVEHGANINSLRDERGATSPDVQDSTWSTQMTELGFEVKYFEEKTGTPLHAAANLGHDSIVQFLIDNGADVNLKRARYGTCQKHVTSLFRQMRVARADNGHIEFLRLYWERNCYDLRRSAENDYLCEQETFLTPWEIAMSNGHEGAAHLIFAAGADTRSSAGKICIASQIHSMSTVAFLIESGVDVNGACIDHSSPLIAAVKANDMAMVRLLLENGADINFEDHEWGTALHAAIQFGSVDTVRLLVENGAEKNYHDQHRGTPLHHAVNTEFMEAVLMLLENGADANFQCECHGSALGTATKQRSMKYVALLIKHGADAGVISGDHRILTQAILDGKLDNAVSLLENGADLTLAESYCKFPFMNYLRFQRNIAMYRLLQKHGAEEMMWVVPE